MSGNIPRMTVRRPARSGRGRRLALIVVFAIVAFLVLAKLAAGTLIDVWWFQSAGYRSMWWRLLRPKLFLFGVFAVIFAVIAVVNMIVADRLAPVAFTANTHPLVERFHRFFGRAMRPARIALCLVLAVLAGIPAVAQWKEWLLFRHAHGFGVTDAQFHKDVGFFVFRLPFILFTLNWLFLSLAVITLLVVGTHALNGGIAFSPPRPKIRRAAWAHIAVMLALVALVRAALYWMSRYALTTDTRGIVRGALYTGIHADLPALTVLAMIAVLTAALFVASAGRASWRLPALACAIWVLFAVLGSMVFPPLMQKLWVNGNQAEREAPYIERNVRATRAAMGIDKVERKTFTIGRVTSEALRADTAALARVRMLDPTQLVTRFNTDRGARTGLAINDLDPDRYMIDGQRRQVLVAALDLDLSTVANRSWQGTHLIATHGCGLTMADAGQTDGSGRPVYRTPELNRPELYFSDTLSGYAVANTGVRELGCDGQSPGSYAGVGGVRLSGLFKRLIHALGYMDYNLLGSGAIDSSSRLLDVRRVQDRAAKLAPFLHFDADPYPVALHGRVVWVIDGYTSTDAYPYAQRAEVAQLPAKSGLRHELNYARNSVKAVVDAYDGTVSLFVVDSRDPIIRTWEAAFPGLFLPAAAMDPALAEHLRYPEDLFRLQSSMYSKYQVEPAQFLERDRTWSVSPAPDRVIDPRETKVVIPTTAPADGSGDAAGGVGLATDSAKPRFVPYYTMLADPTGDPAAAPTFQLVRPFVPFSPQDRRTELRALMTADSDPARYGRLAVYEASADGVRLDGPAATQATIEADKVVSERLTQWSRVQSKVLFGDMQAVRVGQGLVWVVPLYLQGDAIEQPLFQQIVVVANGRVAMGDSLRGALAQLFPGFATELGDVVGVEPGTAGPGAGPTTVPPGPGEPAGPGGPGGPADPAGPAGEETPSELLARADALFAEAEQAMRNGDLGAYRAKNLEARELVRRALEGLGGTPASIVPGDLVPSGSTPAGSTP